MGGTPRLAHFPLLGAIPAAWRSQFRGISRTSY